MCDLFQVNKSSRQVSEVDTIDMYTNFPGKLAGLVTSIAALDGK